LWRGEPADALHPANPAADSNPLESARANLRFGSGPVKPIYLMTMRIVRFRRKMGAAIAILSAAHRAAAIVPSPPRSFCADNDDDAQGATACSGR
jgi:hypothetical protein